MRPRICLLVNSSSEVKFLDLLAHYLPEDRYAVSIAESFPPNPAAFNLIIPWNYRKIIKNAEEAGNVVVVHSSNLPEGRGWAPIYNVFREEKSEYVVSLIYAVDEVDAGDIIMQAHFPILPDYTAEFVRKLDDELSLLMIAKILGIWPDRKPLASKQVGNPTYRQRRYPKDNEIDLNMSVLHLLPHLKGVESSNPSFFSFEGVKYILEVRPAVPPIKPEQVVLEFPALGKREVWKDWK
jgi:methionyl-tRNA formyltransferase